ncbi:hypothetical protein DL96DRAFT_1630874 [Flagelloscypha sp. PMI_526]|nr:hypothetical protein DL96DRAFT_1630874 [Flagelloscypha sp. PMI_526]
MTFMADIGTTPHLPPELERPIFTFAAQCFSGTLPNLLLVARRTYEWLEPLRYFTLRFGPNMSPEFRSLLKQKSSSFLEAHVFFTTWQKDGQDSQDSREFLPKCLGAIHVVFQYGTLDSFSSLARYFRLRTLSLDAVPAVSFSLCLNHSTIFPALTHLEYNGALIQTCARLVHHCPSLTHLMLYDWEHSTQSLSNILNIKKICLVAIVHDHNKPMPDVDLFKHEKLIPVTRETVAKGYFERDWLQEIPDRVDFWKRAEQILQFRKRSSHVIMS